MTSANKAKTMPSPTMASFDLHELGVREAFRLAVRDLGSMDTTIDHIVLTQEPQDAPAQMLLRYAEDRTAISSRSAAPATVAWSSGWWEA